MVTFEHASHAWHSPPKALATLVERETFRSIQWTRLKLEEADLWAAMPDSRSDSNNDVTSEFARTVKLTQAKIGRSAFRLDYLQSNASPRMISCMFTSLQLLCRRTWGTLIGAAILAGMAGCIHQPQMIPADRQKSIDRKLVEYPSGMQLVMLVDGLNSPTAMCVDDEGSLLVAESGGIEPHIFGFHKDGSYFNIYPYKRSVSFYPGGFVIFGPIGGMKAHAGKIYISHHDRLGKGVISALGYDGTHSTVIADLPAQGDYGVNDIVLGTNGRLYFGVGTATNSGVVGVDNWNENWLKALARSARHGLSPPAGAAAQIEWLSV